jgi:alpha-glucosidase (family GH31 glycosyl hydrolase)
VTSLLLAAPAGAAVRIGDDRIAVTSRGDAVVIQRAPFGIAVRDGARTVLRSVAGERRARPRRLPVTRDPEPLALERERDNAVYAPLTFEVGTERRAQWEGSFWPGNMLFARRSGTIHTATRVVGARRAGSGVRLTVRTTDRRRLLDVLVKPHRTAGFTVTAAPRRARGVMAMAASFRARGGEGFHGFGGRHTSTNLRGEKLYGWVEQENVGGNTLRATAALPAVIEEGTDFTQKSLGLPDPVTERHLPGGYEKYMVPNGPNAAYYPQNQFISSGGYGFVLGNPQLSRWRMGNDRASAWQVHASASRLRFTVVPGRPAQAVRGVTAITGRHRLPPAWSQGAILWRAIQVAQPAETAESVMRKIDADLEEIARRGAPIRGYAFEGWNLLGPERTKAVIDRLHAMGIRAILYVRAYVAYDELNSQPAGDVEFVRANGLAVKDAQGRPATYKMTGVDALTLDFTNPRTQAWWKQRLELLLGLGADGFMQDFGEHVMESDRFADGSTGRTMHNRYPVVYHRFTRSIEDELERRYGRELWWFTRSGFTGSARYEMGNFPGDETAEWTGGSGLRSLAPDMLNRAVGGAFGYTTDIGGYLDRFNPPADEELWTRWNEWAVLTPYFRLHNSQTTGTRMPWSFGDSAYARWEALARLHERAIPLIRRLWEEGRRTGVPPTRPLWLQFPGDRRAAAQDQQWMLGPDVLVAPVVTQGATTRPVYFPAGCWRSPETGVQVMGPRTQSVDAPLGRLPYFFRCGTAPF